MKFARVIIFGIALWGLTLVWPDINQGLAEPITMKMIIGLSVVLLAYIIAQHLDWYHAHYASGTNDQVSRPITIIPSHS